MSDCAPQKCPKCNSEIERKKEANFDSCKNCGTVVYKSTVERLVGSLDKHLPANLPVDEVVKHAKYG